MSEGSDKPLVAVNLNIIRNLARPNTGLVIHKQRFDMVTFVAKVVSIHDESTRVSYLVTDFTSAPMDAVKWKSTDTNPGDTGPKITAKSYVRIHGQVSFKNNTLYLAAFKVTLVEDLNELTMHNLEVIHNCLLLRKIKMDYYASRGDLPFEMNTKPLMPTSYPGVNSNKNKEAALMESIKKVVESTLTDVNGVTRDELYERFPSYTRSYLDEVLTTMINEGHLYTTTDDNHFQSANL